MHTKVKFRLAGRKCVENKTERRINMLWYKIKFILFWPIFMLPAAVLLLVGLIGKVCEKGSDKLIDAYEKIVFGNER